MTNSQVVALFFCTFMNVFLIGMQSRNVMSSRIIAAVITSFGISVANFTFIHFAATGSLTAFFVSAVGGCLGIIGSIKFYNRFMPMKKQEAPVDKTTLKIKLEVDTSDVTESLRQLEIRINRRKAELAELAERSNEK